MACRDKGYRTGTQCRSRTRCFIRRPECIRCWAITAGLSGNKLRRSCRGCQLRVGSIGGHGLAEEMALSFMAALHSYLPHLIFGLDAFRDHNFVQAGAEGGDGSDDRLCVMLFTEAANERLVDLDLLEGELAQVIEGGIASAEIVERDTDAEILKLLHCS